MKGDLMWRKNPNIKMLQEQWLFFTLPRTTEGAEDMPSMQGMVWAIIKPSALVENSSCESRPKKQGKKDLVYIKLTLQANSVPRIPGVLYGYSLYMYLPDMLLYWTLSLSLSM